MKRRRIISVLLAAALLIGMAPGAMASLEEPTTMDVVIAQTQSPYYLHFPDIVNVPASVYQGAQPNGKLLTAYYKNTVHAPSSSSQPFGTIELVESTDNGLTWSSPRELVSSAKLLQWGIGTSQVPLEARDPNFALLNDGTVLLTFFTRRYSTDSSIKVYLMESADGGETWSAPELIPCATLNSWCAKRGNIAVFDDDEILVPVYGSGTSYPSSTAINIKGHRDAQGDWVWTNEYLLATSSTLGATINEVSLIATGGDTVYALAREPGYLWVSNDRGATYTRAGDQGALHQPGLIRVDENRVFCTWTRPASPRPVYGKMFFLDRGWEGSQEKLIYRYPSGSIDMGDPSAVLTNDGRLLTVYYVTGVRAIGGTFSDPEDWDPLELSGGGDRWRLFEDDFEDDPAGSAYANSYFNYNTGSNNTITVQQDGDNRLLRYMSRYTTAYQLAQMVTKGTFAGDYSATFDLRFNEDTPAGGLQELYVAMLFSSGTYVLHLRPDAMLFKLAGGVVADETAKTLTPGEWYSVRCVRSGSTVYARAWPKGTAEPAAWDIVCTNSGISGTGTYRMAYITSDTAGQTLDVDSLILSRQINLSLSETSLTRAEGSPAVQLTATVTPPQTGAAVLWESSDASVATVNASGLVSFVGQGSTLITALLGNVRKSCAVTVTERALELTSQGSRWDFFSEDFEDDTVGAAYANSYFNYSTGTNNTAIVRQSGGSRRLELMSKYASGYNMPQLVTKTSASEDYTAQFNFCFAAGAPSGGIQEMYISIQHSLGVYVTHLRAEGIVFKTSGGAVQAEVAKAHTPGSWYTVKVSRAAGGIYVKTWPMGGTEPETFDVAYLESGVTSGATAFRMAYLSSSTAGQTMQIDNLSLSKRSVLTLSETQVAAAPTDPPLQLTLTAAPDLAAALPVPSSPVWSSSDPSVASVSGAGLVTFLSAGSAVISAVYAGETIQCEVTVEPVQYAVSLDRDTLEVEPGADPVQLTASVQPSAGAPAVVWSSGNPQVVAVSDTGLLTFTGEGMTYIRAKLQGRCADAICVVLVRASD